MCHFRDSRTVAWEADEESEETDPAEEMETPAVEAPEIETPEIEEPEIADD